jgi:O-antigen ligase
LRSASLIIDPDNLPTVGKRWDQFLFTVLVALLFFMPAAFGAVEAWSELVVVVGAAILSISLILRILFDRDFQLTTTWLYLPLFLLLLLVALQFLPLPTSIARFLAPANLETKENLLATSFEPATIATISFYPLVTSRLLRVLLIGGTVFVVVAALARRAQYAKALLAAIFLIGCLEAGLSLAQIATGTGSIYWYFPLKSGVHTAGTFINYSNFSQFMNLSLGAGLALLLVRGEEQRRNGFQDGNWTSAARSYWEKNSWVCAGLLLCALAVLGSMSRNGVLSLMIAAMFTGVVLFKRRSSNWTSWFVAAIPVALLAVLLFFGFDTVYNRLATIRHNESYSLRWEMTVAAFRTWQHYPWFGTGLGTHEIIAPLFETATTPNIAENADNDFAQLLEETGLFGVAIVTALLLGVAALIVKLILSGRRPLSAASYGILFAILAVAIHSTTDFGQRLPANLSLTAALSGLVVAIASAEPRRHNSPRSVSQFARRLPPWLRMLIAAGTLVVLGGVWAWSIRESYAAYLGERWWSAATAIDSTIQRKPDVATDDVYLDRIAAAEGAFQSQPQNVKYGYWLSCYRWELLSRDAETASGQPMMDAAALPYVERIADELFQLRRICPTYGPPYALEGQLRWFVLGQPHGADLIRTGAKLASYDPPTCLVAGELAAREGRMQEAEALLTRAVQLQPSFYDEVIQLYLTEVKRPDLAEALAGDDYRRLYALAGAFEKLPDYANRIDATKNRAEDALRKYVAGGTPDTAAIAQVARLDHDRGNLKQAIDLYSRALSHDYQQTEWHLALAHALAENGQVEEAIHEVKIVLRLRPRESNATKFLDELVSRSENIRTRRAQP